MEYRDFGFADADASHMHRHFLSPLFALSGKLGKGMRVLDVGCGNGYTAGRFADCGCEAVDLDLSEKGIALARASYPRTRFEILSADDQIFTHLGCEPFLQFRGVGRLPALWMTMLISGVRPS